LPVASGRYRQDKRLTPEEQARYLTFPRWFRERVESLEGED
jgi:site-specific DNA-cytosine methylase